MVVATCHRCEYEWDYTGSSDRYGTCPNCKTSVKLDGGSERATAKPERCGDPSDRTVGINGSTVPVVEAVESLDNSVAELYQMDETLGDELAELRDRVEEDGEIQEVREGLRELAKQFTELVEEMGGAVQFEEIEVGTDLQTALDGVEAEASEV